MQRIDTEKILNDNPIADVIGRYLALKKEGAHLKGTCPFHDDHHASLTVTPSKNLAKCFACGWSGDSIAFVMEYAGKTFHEACKEIDAHAVSEQTDGKPKRQAKPKQAPRWRQRTPPEACVGEITHYRHGEASMMWLYRLADGRPYAYVCRFDTPDGKEVLPYTWCTDGNRSEWRWQGFDNPRPLYNLHLLEANPTATVLLVEGEKTADAAQAQLDPTKTVVTTWPGGSMAIAHVDWVPLHGRKVLMWPDNDVQGISAMLHIRHLVERELGVCKIVPLDTTLPKGWDCADQEWQPGELRSFVLSRIVDDIPPNSGALWRMKQIDRDSVYVFGIMDGRWQFKEAKTDPPPAPEPPPLPEYDNPEPPAYEQDYIGYGDYFKFLGWDKSEGSQRYYFFQKEAKTTLSFSASNFTKSGLITLAPLSFWETYFPAKNGISLDAAQEFLIRTSVKLGPFNERYIRGRGAWVDKDRVIIHKGTQLIVDGIAEQLGSIDSKFIYETSDDLGIDPSNPLPTKDANRLMDIMNLLNWDREINAYLLAGWCVVAPVCGALKWRPHIWLTGSAGTGKSWVFQHLVRRLLGETALAVQGETSEAGLRQTLGHDALPVVFDEADIDDKRSAERIQNILTLMRSASADNGGLLLKGSATGQAKSYSIRSCFAFASIGVQAAQQSDRSRITILGMRSLPDERLKKERWQNLQALYHQTLTDEYVQGLQARTVKLLPTILKNTQTFANAAASVLGEQRAGDQLGALLAGAYSLYSDKEITYEAALEWVSSKDWTEERGLHGTKDELMLLSHIMGHMTSIELEYGRVERTIGELVLVAANRVTEVFIPDVANARLKRLGMKVEDGKVLISNSEKFILNLLKDTAWSKNHNKILMRLPGAADKKSARFASGVITRAVAIPLELLQE